MSANRICSVLVSTVLIFGMHAAIAPLSTYAQDVKSADHGYVLSESKESSSC